ncbi:MAG: hypothetical protein A2Y53_02080 [Chloroflexi bacterium RBG_16_47_49]|nr:MAG: hypothetical protein A2Y53_02080 [Chloroflexi bacterium RBG_16_47_49]
MNVIQRFFGAIIRCEQKEGIEPFASARKPCLSIRFHYASWIMNSEGSNFRLHRTTLGRKPNGFQIIRTHTALICLSYLVKVWQSLAHLLVNSTSPLVFGHQSLG